MRWLLTDKFLKVFKVSALVLLVLVFFILVCCDVIHSGLEPSMLDKHDVWWFAFPYFSSNFANNHHLHYLGDFLVDKTNKNLYNTLS